MSLWKILKNEKGSSSIFIVIILFCLLTFGLLSLMSSYADLKLADKSESWVLTYYNLDNQGSVFLQEVDNYLHTAKDYTLSYLNGSPVVAGDEAAAQQAGLEALLASAGVSSVYYSEDQIFLVFAQQILQQAGYQTQPETIGQILSSRAFDGYSLTVEHNFSSSAENNAHNLAIELGVIPLSQADSLLYKILRWQQWQNQIDVEGDSFKLWTLESEE
ncbi:MAG: hypothetical protein LBR98_00800 [Syntrophomonadaceae bacterium]|jgi:hypothetical protein|nr:hypothetical protein [Syntrophomonadaceae bacterium]